MTTKKGFAYYLSWTLIIISSISILCALIPIFAMDNRLIEDQIHKEGQISSIKENVDSNLNQAIANDFKSRPIPYFVGMSLFCTMVLISSIGLLKRKKWARIILIITALLISFWIAAAFFIIRPLPDDKQPQIVMYVLGSIKIVLLGWISYKLIRLPIYDPRYK